MEAVVEFESYDYFVIFFLAVLGLIVVLSSIYDTVTKSLKRKQIKILCAFSVPKNLKSLLNFEKSDSSIGVINGLKALSVIWIVMGHRSARINKPDPDTMQFWDKILFAFVGKFYYAVTTFFACSGVLVTMSFLRSFERSNCNIIKVFVDRYIRFIIPIMVLTIFFTSNLPLMMVKGPQMYHLEEAVGNCKMFWWKSLFFMTNGEWPELCLYHTWYLSVDMQLFIITPAIVYVFWKLGKKSTKFLILLIAIYKGWTYYRISTTNHTESLEIYSYTQYRLGEYLVGMLFGFILHNTKNKTIKFNPFLMVLGWLLCLGFIVEYIKDGALRDGIYRELWSASICWIIFATHKLKFGGVIKSFLAHPIWLPVSKMTLSVYLIHYMYIQMTYVIQDSVTYFSSIWLIQIFLGDVLMALIFGIIFYVVIEAPSVHLKNFMWEKVGAFFTFVDNKIKNVTSSGTDDQAEKGKMTLNTVNDTDTKVQIATESV